MACIHAGVGRSYFVDDLLECFLGRVAASPPTYLAYFPAGRFAAPSWGGGLSPATPNAPDGRPAPLESLFHASALAHRAHFHPKNDPTILSLSLSLSLSKKLDFPREIIRNMNRPFFLETDRRPGAECHWETYSQRFPEFRRSELWKFRNSKRTGKSRRWSISTKIDFWLESSKRFLDGNFDTHPAKISYSLGVLIQWIFHVPRHTLDLKLAIELSQKCLVVYFFFSITSPLAFKKNTQTKLCILNWYSHRTAKTYKSARQTEIKIDRFPLSRRVSCG